MTAPTVLLLPGWQNSVPAHWQSRWEAVPWRPPRRAARLDAAAARRLVGPAGRGGAGRAEARWCWSRTAWAASWWPPGPRIRATPTRCRPRCWWRPGDLEREDLREMIPGWAPIVRQRLPFRGAADRRQRRSLLRARALARPGATTGARAPSTTAPAATQRRIRPGRLARRPRAAERPDERRMTSMATKKPKGLGRGLEALLGPDRHRPGQRRERRRRAAQPDAP